jgi:Coenzyme PQQ synthesis protein D (PqqD)
MDSDSRLGINAGRVFHQALDGEVIIIDYDTGAYYSTDKAGAEVWGWIARGATLRQIVEALTQQYYGDSTTISTAVSQFIDELASEALIVPKQDAPDARVAESKHGEPTDRPAFEAPALHKYTDMQDLLLVDPIHQVSESGWPAKRQTDG